MPQSTRLRAIFMLILATAAWGYSFPAGKALQAAWAAELPGRSGFFFSGLMIAARFLLAALLLWAWNPRALARMRPSEWRQGIGLGVFSGLGMWFQADGLNHTTASAVAFLTQGTAVLVPLYLALRHRRLPGGWMLACIAMVMAGVAILGQFDWRTLRFGRGEFETLVGTAFFTAQILWLEWPVFRGNDMSRVSIAMFFSIAAVLTPFVIAHSQSITDLRLLALSGPTVAIFISLTLICSLLAFLLMNHWQPHIDATSAGIVYCSEPLFATAFALFLPIPLGHFLGIPYANETFTSHLLIGGGLITLANILISLLPAPKPHPEDSPPGESHQPAG
jgi:drug/metabolite transporter (DMT)-like permease